MLKFVFIYAVRKCPVIGRVKHATANDTGVTWQTVINYECRVGFWFNDRTFTRTVRCLGDGMWDQDMEDCKRNYDYIYMKNSN